VVFCRSRKPADHRGKVLLIDAVNEVARERAMSFLRPEHQARIAGAYAAFSDQEGFAAVATLAEIAAQGHSLSIPLYVKRPAAAAGEGGGQAATLQEAWQAWEASGQEFWQQMDGVVAMLDGLVAEVFLTDSVNENQE
jgi:type I restriction enzyme M protein